MESHVKHLLARKGLIFQKNIRPVLPRWGILPKFLWSPLVYEVTMITVETLERSNSYLWKFLEPGVLRTQPVWKAEQALQLPLRCAEEEYKAKKARQVMMLEYSRDTKVSEAETQGPSRCMCAGRQDLAMTHGEKLFSQKRRQLVSQEVRKKVEERQAKTGMQQQGVSMRWKAAACTYKVLRYTTILECTATTGQILVIRFSA